MLSGTLARLGGWWSGLLTLVLSALTSWLGKRAALATAVITGYLALLATLWAAIALLVSSIAMAAPSGGIFEAFWQGFFLIMPSNWIACASACLSADVAVFLYRFHANRIAAPVAGG